MTTELTLPEAIEDLPKTWKNIEFSQLISLVALSGITLWSKSTVLLASMQIIAGLRFNLRMESFYKRQAAAASIVPARAEALRAEAEALDKQYAEASTRYAKDMASLVAINTELEARAALVRKVVSK